MLTVVRFLKNDFFAHKMSQWGSMLFGPQRSSSILCESTHDAKVKENKCIYPSANDTHTHKKTEMLM